MPNPSLVSTDVDQVIAEIIDAFQAYAATATTTYNVVDRFTGTSYNVSSVLTVSSATSSVGTVLGTIANTAQTGGLLRTTAQYAILKSCFNSLVNSDPGTQAVGSYSIGASTTWNTEVCTVTRL